MEKRFESDTGGLWKGDVLWKVFWVLVDHGAKKVQSPWKSVKVNGFWWGLDKSCLFTTARQRGPYLWSSSPSPCLTAPCHTNIYVTRASFTPIRRLAKTQELTAAGSMGRVRRARTQEWVGQGGEHASPAQVTHRLSVKKEHSQGKCWDNSLYRSRHSMQELGDLPCCRSEVVVRIQASKEEVSESKGELDPGMWLRQA